ncbi:hypothetical protein LLH06_08610 [Mucilaginibacter daejeonensis]|uniref:hypothetical protein n=1 Tax=Mucilaginibacter daejeonensis TaxID=398049 RepID=UPI001D1718A5|nr:hypothetical protein [Mucilaginibacter daejeonensis]UEG55024.1 hypothetical protein LLH06_08610 [Mucilaginibacter daejeonensis]
MNLLQSLRVDHHSVMPSNYDEDLDRAIRWFLSFISKSDWEKRKALIENHIEQVLATAIGLQNSDADSIPIHFHQDKIVWYLYLMEKSLYDASSYEPVAGARVLPVFQRIGRNLEQMQQVGGVHKRVRKLMNNTPNEADAVIFELLVSLLWVRNGWKVEFIEDKKAKQPDFKAEKGKREWYVECKRLEKTSDYSVREKAKWLKMLSLLSPLLLKLNLILDLVFHVEILSLQDDFMERELSEKLPLMVTPGIIISNEIWDVSASFVDYSAINLHLRDFSVRSPSPQLYQLIGGKLDNNRGFTSGYVADLFRLGPGRGNNIFADGLSKAYGARWSCDAPEAIDKKARDIKKQLSKALEQLPQGPRSVVHIGIETYEGADVERHRLDKITATVEDIGLIDKNLQWVYCHFFQAYAPPDQFWVFDESLSRYRNILSPLNEPLKHTSLVVPWEKTEENNLHWFKPQP